MENLLRFLHSSKSCRFDETQTLVFASTQYQSSFHTEIPGAANTRSRRLPHTAQVCEFRSAIEQKTSHSWLHLRHLSRYVGICPVAPSGFALPTHHHLQHLRYLRIDEGGGIGPFKLIQHPPA